MWLKFTALMKNAVTMMNSKFTAYALECFIAENYNNFQLFYCMCKYFLRSVNNLTDIYPSGRPLMSYMVLNTNDFLFYMLIFSYIIQII